MWAIIYPRRLWKSVLGYVVIWTVLIHYGQGPVFVGDVYFWALTWRLGLFIGAMHGLMSWWSGRMEAERHDNER